MARLRSSLPGELYISRAMEEPDPTPRAKGRNGRYRGKLPVRTVAQGVSGKDLSGGERAPAGDQLWKRGNQLIQVLHMEGPFVVFRELSHGKGIRRMRLTHFLRTSHPQVGA